MTQIFVKSSDSDEEKTINNILSQALKRERKILLAALEKTKLHLNSFEEKYSKSSSIFFEEYKNGLAGDSEDIIDWAGEYQLYLNIKNKLNSLKDVIVADQ